MSEPENPDPADVDLPNQSRMALVWDVIVFQFKLAADGLRDLLLVPVSLFAALAGLLTSGSDPGRYYRMVLRLGRRSEYWINLFGHRKHRGTADEFIQPMQEKVFAQVEGSPLLRKAGAGIDRSLDSINRSIEEQVAARGGSKESDADSDAGRKTDSD